MKIILLLILLGMYFIPCWSQQSSMMIGARAMSLGNASACLSDEFSLFNNIAGLAKVTQTAAGFSYDAHPSIIGFNRIAALLTVPFKIGTIGGGLFRFGDDLYNEQIISFGFANTFGLASLGAKLNYVQYHAEGFGNASAFTVSFGGIAELTETVSIGAHIVNINQPRISETTSERIPTVLVLGLRVNPGEKLSIVAEIEKDISLDPIFKAGLEYEIYKKLMARTGFNLNPRAGYVGLGFQPGKFSLAYAFQYDMTMGHAHQATVVCRFKK